MNWIIYLSIAYIVIGLGLVFWLRDDEETLTVFQFLGAVFAWPLAIPAAIGFLVDNYLKK